jgi:hypothetical protein
VARGCRLHKIDDGITARLRAANESVARSYRLRARGLSVSAIHEITNELRDAVRSGIEREMISIENVEFGRRHVNGHVTGSDR